MGMPPPIEVANLGMWDSLILMVMALVVFGPRRLPEIGRQIGKLMYEVRKASNDFKFQMEEELRNAEEADRRKREEGKSREQGSGIRDQEPVPAVESPYSGEGVYPELTAPANAAQAEETYPRILPPATGETVEAARPGGPAAQVATDSETAEEAAGAALSAEPEVRAEQVRAEETSTAAEITNG